MTPKTAKHFPNLFLIIFFNFFTVNVQSRRRSITPWFLIVCIGNGSALGSEISTLVSSEGRGSLSESLEAILTMFLGREIWTQVSATWKGLLLELCDIRRLKCKFCVRVPRVVWSTFRPGLIPCWDSPFLWSNLEYHLFSVVSLRTLDWFELRCAAEPLSQPPYITRFVFHVASSTAIFRLVSNDLLTFLAGGYLKLSRRLGLRLVFRKLNFLRQFVCNRFVKL